MKLSNQNKIEIIKTAISKINKPNILELGVQKGVSTKMFLDICNRKNGKLTSIDIQDAKGKSIVKYSAGGLRDFTRIAASNPIMWRDIFIQNKKNTSEMIDKFIKNLQELKSAIENEDGKKIEKIFTKTKKIRKEIVEAGQDVKKPDFGRK